MPTTQRSNFRQRNLALLAEVLIARHLRISLPDSTIRDDLAKAQHSPPYQVDMVERRTRCIAVVGAGASASLLARANDLATELEKDFGRDDTELERLELVSGFPRDNFETRLIALSRSPETAIQVRERISDKYNIRHPALLGYELLAHLLKHRFLDGIISFNFDELLDRSLDDELSKDEYKRIVSERDCADIQTDADATKYVPLYVKLHGTASEPQSLRFTPDSYYALPKRMVEVVRELLHADRCVIICVGSGLGSFDFQRLLGIPQQLDVFNLSVKPLSAMVVKRIAKERGNDRDKSWLHDCSSSERSPDELVQELTSCLHNKSCRNGASPDPSSAQPPGINELVRVRSVLRHEAVAKLLGPHTIMSGPETTPDWLKASEIDYLRRRTILELALSAAKARGLLSLVPLVLDRPARYYETYQQLTGTAGEDWSTFCSASGLEESEDTTDILVSNRSLRRSHNGSLAEQGGTHLLHEFDPRKLALHVLPRVKNPWSRADLAMLENTIADIQCQSDVEIHTTDDRVCSKAFRRPVILSTATSLQTYTWLMLQKLERKDEVCISSEVGAWLLDEPILGILKDQSKIRALFAFDIEQDELALAYKGLKSHVIDPWRHNRHMTIVYKEGRPSRAIYFARRLRTPVITPVYLEGMRDVQRLTRMFEERWVQARRRKKKLPRREVSFGDLPSPGRQRSR
jgi:SIR2-like domain